MNYKDKYISDLESEIQYLKKLLDDNGISYDYEAHLRALHSDVGDIVFPELGPEHAGFWSSISIIMMRRQSRQRAGSRR